MKTRIMRRDHLYTVCPTMERLAKVSCVCMCVCVCVLVWMRMCVCFCVSTLLGSVKVSFNYVC